MSLKSILKSHVTQRQFIVRFKVLHMNPPHIVSIDLDAFLPPRQKTVDGYSKVIMFERVSFMAGVRRRGTQWALSRATSKLSLMTRKTLLSGVSMRSANSRIVKQSVLLQQCLNIADQVAPQTRRRTAISLLFGAVGATSFEWLFNPSLNAP